jgi:hypothetical protein
MKALKVVVNIIKEYYPFLLFGILLTYVFLFQMDTDRLFFEDRFYFVLEEKRYNHNRGYVFSGHGVGDGQDRFSLDYGSFESYGLLPLFNQAVSGDTLMKRAGDSTIYLKGRNGVKVFTARLILKE